MTRSMNIQWIFIEWIFIESKVTLSWCDSTGFCAMDIEQSHIILMWLHWLLCHGYISRAKLLCSGDILRTKIYRYIKNKVFVCKSDKIREHDCIVNLMSNLMNNESDTKNRYYDSNNLMWIWWVVMRLTPSYVALESLEWDAKCRHWDAKCHHDLHRSHPSESAASQTNNCHPIFLMLPLWAL